MRALEFKRAERVVLVCLCWYLAGGIGGVTQKRLLERLPFPITVALIDQISLLGLVQTITAIRGSSAGFAQPPRFWVQILALGSVKVIVVVASQISVWKTAVSYAYTVKASGPFFTVVMSRILLRERHSLLVHLSLVPIVIGITVTSYTELSFDMVGLVSALLSACASAFMNITSKKIIKEITSDEVWLLRTVSVVVVGLLLPLWMVIELPSLLSTKHDVSLHLIVIATVNGIVYSLSNMLALTAIGLLSSLSHSIALCLKRVVVIAVSLVVIGNPVTPLNLAGVTVAISGALIYNRVCMDQFMFIPFSGSLPYHFDSCKKDLLSVSPYRHGMKSDLPPPAGVRLVPAP